MAYTWMPSLFRGHNVNAGPFDSEVEAAEAADALRVQLVSTTLCCPLEHPSVVVNLDIWLCMHTCSASRC